MEEKHLAEFHRQMESLRSVKRKQTIYVKAEKLHTHSYTDS